jgi:ribonuclease HI
MTKTIHLWTDGSSINNGENKGLGGHGYVLLYGDFEGVDITTKYCDDKFTLTGWEGASETTNQREEMKACIEGLKKIKNHSIPVTVFADSAYLINCMNQRWFDKWRINGWKNSKKEPVANQDLWEELLDVIESNMMFVKFDKVKGHSKVFYNEQCDVLARQGLDKMRGRL